MRTARKPRRHTMTTPVDPREALAKALFERTMSALYATSLTWDCTDQVHWRSEADHLLATVVSLGYRPAHEVETPIAKRVGKVVEVAFSDVRLRVVGNRAIWEPVSPVTETPEEPK
jgi:hypothetical protein